MTLNVTNVCNYVITLIVSRYDSFVPVTIGNIFQNIPSNQDQIRIYRKNPE